jgi:hypothetical protein
MTMDTMRLPETGFVFRQQETEAEKTLDLGPFATVNSDSIVIPSTLVAVP